MSKRTKGVCTAYIVVLLIFYQNYAFALDWKARPSLNLRQIYSDNIKLSNTDKQSALVTELSPGISVNGTSAVSKFNFNYRMQNLYNAGGDGGLDVNNQLQMNTNYEFLRNKLYLDSNSSISQQNTSNRRLVGDNISGSDNTSTVSTFRLSPYWTPHFNKYADGKFRVTYDRVNTDGGNTQLSTTNSFSQDISLNSGKYFSDISWSLSFRNSNRTNSNGQDVNFQRSSALLRYAIDREFSVFARIGYSSNSFASNSNNNNNGVSYTFGGRWQPSRRFSLEAGYGNNRFVTVSISPFNRLQWITTYTNNDIGLNTGDVWNTALRYSTKRSNWTLDYSEQTTTTQQLLLDQQVFTNPEDIQAVENQDQQANLRLPTLTDEVFISKRASLSVSYRTGKSNVSAQVFRTIRSFEQQQNEDTVTGIRGSWSWRYSRRTSYIFRSSWQKTESDGLNSFSDKRFDISLRATRTLFSHLNGNIEYRFVDQNSDNNLNGYSENRITANLSLHF